MIDKLLELAMNLLNRLNQGQLFIFLILSVIAVVLISVYGKFALKWGKAVLGIGKDKPKKSDDSKPVDPPENSKIIQVVKRSCGDCILMIIGEREKHELKKSSKKDRVLKDQMNFAEQKLIEIQTTFIEEYAQKIKELRKNTANIEQENVQNKLFYGLLRDAIYINIRDTMRRAFKENGFYELDGNEFAAYVKDKSKILIAMITQHMRNLYPISPDIIVTIDDVITMIEDDARKVEDIAFEIFIHAKDVKLTTDSDIKGIDTEFSDWVNNFIK